MKYEVVLSERAVRSLMGSENIPSILQLSNLLSSETGLGKNTIYDALDGGFSSKTLSAIAQVFDLRTPEELALILTVKVVAETDEEKEWLASQEKNEKHPIAPRATAFLAHQGQRVEFAGR